MAYKTLTLDLLLTCLRGGGRLGAGLGAAFIPFSLGSYVEVIHRLTHCIEEVNNERAITNNCLA